MKIVGISGSPHKKGGALQLLLAALKGAQREGAQTELYNVYDGEIKPCIGCIKNEERGCRFPCIFEDYGQILLKKIHESDGIIFATPVYWFAPSGPLKNFLDRMTCLENMIAYGEPSYMEGKIVGAIAVGADAGCLNAAGYLITVLNSMGAIVPPWGIAYSHKGDKALWDNKALLDAINIGILVSRMISLMKGERRKISFEEDHALAQAIQREILSELELTSLPVAR